MRHGRTACNIDHARLLNLVCQQTSCNAERDGMQRRSSWAETSHTSAQLLLSILHYLKGPDCFCRDLHKEVVAGIDEAMARHAQETDKVDLLTLKKLKGRVNVLEQQIVTDKAKQLTVSHSPALPPCIALNLCCCCMANGCDSYGAWSGS